jgi:azurin
MRALVRSLLTVALALVPFVPSVAAQATPRTLVLTATDAMQYSMTTINAKPGEQIKIVLKVTSAQPPETMKHNFVLLQADTDVMAYAMAAVMAKDTGYLPAAHKDKVIAKTDLAAGGQEVTVTFKVPAKPGTYPYICTFPGHFFAGMKGTLVVK